jgi:hypothetical protein
MIATLGQRADFLQLTRQVVFECLRQGAPPFDAWMARVRDLDAHDKGALFEQLCALALRRTYAQVWRLAELPDALREQLALRRADFGIDLVAQDARGACTAVQAKFRATRLTWRELSTFDALAHRTGPWIAHLVMTTAPSIRRIGRRTALDKSYCLGSWRSLPLEFWLDAAQLHGQALGCVPSALGPADPPPIEPRGLAQAPIECEHGQALGCVPSALDRANQPPQAHSGLDSTPQTLDQPRACAETERERVARLRLARFQRDAQK